MKKEKLELAVSIAALAVALASLVFALIAWSRPLPADPRDIPTLGSVEQPFQVDSQEAGHRLFEFLDTNEGRKIRIIARFDPNYATLTSAPGSGIQSNAVSVPATGDREGITQDVLQLQPTPDGFGAVGLTAGSWEVNGYYANAGLVALKENKATRRIAAIDIVTAVS